MKSQEITKRWVDFFVSKGHTAVPSASLVSSDPSLLFTVAGMVPFIPYLTAREEPPYSRATSVQKCIRTGDIEEVGKTARHGTFFQMCGNFSFGDYFKEDAIKFAWELLTKSVDDGGYGLPPELLWVTVYEEDDEAKDLWLKNTGVPAERIQRMGKSDNYWSTGQPGPAGPCSEIYYDRGPAYGVEGGPLADETRYIEIWNLVFMQYQIENVRSKVDFDIVGELPKKNIDTGLGMERLAMILQGVENMYETDQVRPVIDRAAELSGREYTSAETPDDPHHTDDVRMRVVADHIRSALMLIADGVTPSNEGRGYVLRRLIRRAVRSMRLLGVEQACLPELLPASRDAMKGVYPVVETDFARISRIAYAEEKAFLRTIASGTARLGGRRQRIQGCRRPLVRRRRFRPARHLRLPDRPDAGNGRGSRPQGGRGRLPQASCSSSASVPRPTPRARRAATPTSAPSRSCWQRARPSSPATRARGRIGSAASSAAAGR
jgi:alanyl-tRNA synthetase